MAWHGVACFALLFRRFFGLDGVGWTLRGAGKGWDGRSSQSQDKMPGSYSTLDREWWMMGCFGGDWPGVCDDGDEADGVVSERVMDGGLV